MISCRLVRYIVYGACALHIVWLPIVATQLLLSEFQANWRYDCIGVIWLTFAGALGGFMVHWLSGDLK